MGERDLKQHIQALCGVLEVHRCNNRPTMTVGECIKAKLCACSCELLIAPEPHAAERQVTNPK